MPAASSAIVPDSFDWEGDGGDTVDVMGILAPADAPPPLPSSTTTNAAPDRPCEAPWALPPGAKAAFSIDFSIISQIDGLLSKCRGARVERDMFPLSPASACCHIVGMQAFESTGSFLGWYCCQLEVMPRVIATVASHKGLGVFVVPRTPPGSVADRLVTVGKVGKKKPSYRSVDWWELLEDAAVLTFDLPADAASLMQRAGGPRAALLPLRAVFANFGTNGDFKGLPRDEYLFELSCIPEVAALGPKLGTRPYLSQRVSPLADLKRPLLEEDVLPARPDGPFPVDASVSPPQAVRSTWTSPEWAGAWVHSYPDQRVARLALQALSTGLNPFVGDLTKAVDQAQRTPKVHKAIEIRKALMKEVGLARTAGPFSSAAFPH